MQSHVERECLLHHRAVATLRRRRIENHRPTVGGHHAGDQHERVCLQHGIAERLLTAANGAGPQPIGVRHVRRIDHMRPPGIDDPRRRQNMGDGVERRESLVHGHLQDGRGGIQRCVNRTHPA